MSSCLSRGTGRAYGNNLETIVKSSSSSSLSSATSSRTSNSSSLSSSLSESSNSTMAVIAVTTRKPRTPRKRPNQTYNEAANLLSTACPTIFSTTIKQPKSPNQHSSFFTEPPEFLPPFQATESPIKTKQREIEFNRSSNQSPNSSSLTQSNAYQHDFDTESILDEEIAKGIDSIIGKSNSITQSYEISCENPCFSSDSDFNFDFNNSNSCYGYPVELGFGGNLEINYGFGLKNGVRALRNEDDRNWSFPATNVMNVSPMEKKKKKKVLVEELMKSESEYSIVGDENLLKLKLNYDGVLKAWSEKGSPVPEGISGAESPGSDVNASLAHVDLFLKNEGVRKGNIIRYKEKRHTQFFSKKIKYQVRKVNADRRPRSKGRFVRRPNSPTWEET